MPKRQILPAVQMPCSIFRRKALCITQILTPYRDRFGTNNVKPSNTAKQYSTEYQGNEIEVLGAV